MIGDIILVINKKKSFFPSAIKFFTGRYARKHGVKIFTHSCFSVGQVLGQESVLSAELAMSVMPLDSFRTDDFYFEVYRVKDKFRQGTTKKELVNLISRHYQKSAGKPYGFFQNLWFVYRFLMELIGFNMIGRKNWFPDNENCSESTANYLLDRFDILSYPNTARLFLKEFNTNSIHPVDLAVMIKKNWEIFQLVQSHGFES